MRAILAIFGLLAALPAFAQPVPPPPQLPCGLSTTACLRLAPRGNLRTWMPLGNGTSNNLGTTLWNLGGAGRTMAGVMELEDEYDRVRLRFPAGGTNIWTVTQVVVGSSASYGTTPGTVAGILPYDMTNTSLNTMLPVTFNNAGSCTVTPWTGGTAQYAGTNASGGFMLALAGSVSSSGQPIITFASTVSNAMTGNQSPLVGMYASDGLGHVTAGSKVTAVSATTVTLDTNLAAGITANQQIFFTWVNPVQTFNIVASTNSPSIQQYCSDWIPLSAFPRTDGGIRVGMTAAGTNVSGTVTVVNPASVTIDTPVSGTVPINTAITFSTTATTTGAVSGAFVIPVSSTALLRRGMTVTGTGIPASSWVGQVGPGYIRLNAAATGAVSGTLTFSNVAYTNAATTSGSALPFTSTNNKPLFLVRGAAVAPVNLSGIAPSVTGANLKEQAMGLPYWNFMLGNPGVDNLNTILGVSFPTFQQTFVIGVDYLSRHRGVSIAVAGDSTYSGTTTASNSTNFVRRAAASLSTLERPVSTSNQAFGGQTSNIFLPQLDEMVRQNKPEMVVVQGFSGAGNLAFTNEISKANSVVYDVLAYGGRAIFGNWPMAQTKQVGQFYTSGATSASTTLTLGATYELTAGATFEISGTGIPVGTTASAVIGSPTLTLSQAATVPDGTLVTFGMVTVSGAVNNSTAVTFAHAMPFPSTNNYSVTGTGITAGTTLTITTGSANAVFSSAQTVADGTVITIGTITAQAARQVAMGTLQTEGTGATSFFDAYGCVEDPANPTFYAPAVSQDGVHADDYGHYLQAFGGNNGCSGLKSMLQSIIGN